MSISPNKSHRDQRIVLMVSSALLLVLSAVQLALYFYGYDFSADLYLPGALPTITALIWIAAAVVPCLLCLPLPGKTACREMKIPSTRITDFATLLTMAALVSAAAMPLIAGEKDSLKSLLLSTDIADSNPRTLLLLSLVAAILGALYFLLLFSYRKIRPLGVTALLFWAGLSALRIYFDMRYLLMSPRRVLHLVALVALMVFLVGELRLARGIATPRLYTLTAAPAMVITGADALSNLILTAMGWITPGAELSTYFVLAAASVFIFSRLYALAKPPKAESNKAEASPEPVSDESSEEESPEEESPEKESPEEDTAPDSPADAPDSPTEEIDQ